MDKALFIAVEPAQQSRLVRLALILAVVLAGATCVLLLIAVPSWPVTFYANLATLVVGLVLLMLVQRGRAHAAGMLAIIFMSSMIAVDSLNPARTFGLAAPLLPLLIVFAGLAYGRRALVITTIASCAWLMIVGGTKLVLYPLAVPLSRQQLIDTTAYVMYIVLAGCGTYFALMRIQRADAQAQHANASLKVALLDKTRSEQAHQATSAALRQVTHAATELLNSPTQAAFWQRAVEIARERLEIERCAIFVVEPSGRLRGTYGTTLRGQTIDIHHDGFDRLDVEQTLAKHPERYWVTLDEVQLLDSPTQFGQPPQVAGKGWRTITPIRGNIGSVVAYLFNDNAITQSRLDPIKQDLLALYCSLLGNMWVRRCMHDEAVRAAAIQERTRLARELHDSVSQSLYGVVMGTHTAIQTLSEPERAATALEYVLKQSEAGLTEMRALIFELRPEHLEKEGLLEALRRQVIALCKSHDLKLTENFSGQEPQVSLLVKEGIYRIGIEAVRNAIKHAHATTLTVQMFTDTREVRLEVYDNGLGFDTRAMHNGHLGLQGMRERAAQIQANLDIDSAPGEGTLVRLVLSIGAMETQRA